ncbi:MAG: hypothetical protein WD077_10030 [Bacteroidia bacterium]
MKKITANFHLVAVLAGSLFLYLAFPTSNASIDGYTYAASVKYGEELFHPHHLLYNLQGYALHRAVSSFFDEADALYFMIGLNGIYAFLILVVLLFCLRKMGAEKRKVPWLLMIAAFSFGPWRFATENETYILPILLSVTASYFWINGLQNRKGSQFALSGFFAALAILFHQLHIFWWLGLLAGCLLLKGPGEVKRAVVFTAPALIIPLAYLLALHHLGLELSLAQLQQYALHEYMRGNASAGIGYMSFVLTPISLFRSFFQVHGYVWKMLLIEKAFWIPAIISLFLAIAGLFFLLKRKWQLNRTFLPVAEIHLLILLLTLVFAFLSYGNAEFLAGIPVILVILMACFKYVSTRGLAAIGGALLVWNFWFGIWPLYHFGMQQDEMIARYMMSSPESVFILEDPVRPASIMYYQSHTAPLSAFRCERIDSSEIRLMVEEASVSGKAVFSNCGGQPQVMSRAALLAAEGSAGVLSDFETEVADSAQSFNGWHFLYTVRNRQ